MLSAMDENIAQLIYCARVIYEPIVAGEGSRIQRGNRLWQQFEAAIDGCVADVAGSERQIRERINELATAKVLAEDMNLNGLISYEPDLLPSGRRIDFVAERTDDNLYVEVKSVNPEAADNQETWERYQELRNYHPENVNYIVREDWMGGSIYGNTFAARTKFLEYARAFEERLAEAKNVRPGPGVLVFCGTGFQWNVTDLEDFADFYLLGQHRADDPFALMEQHEIGKAGLKLRRNIDHFAFLKRRSAKAQIQRLHFPVRGPYFGR